MPYIEQNRRDTLATDLAQAKTDGDYNFLYSLEYLKSFIEKPSYATIALIKKASIVPHKIQGVEKIEEFLTVLGVSELDREVARDLAFLEFYRQIGSTYEDFAKATNGDLKEYDEAKTVIYNKVVSTKEIHGFKV